MIKCTAAIFFLTVDYNNALQNMFPDLAWCKFVKATVSYFTEKANGTCYIQRVLFSEPLMKTASQKNLLVGGLLYFESRRMGR